MAIVSLLVFLGIVVLAFVRKTNVGVLAIAAALVLCRIAGLPDKTVVSGISASMFATLAGITLLFSIVSETGALELLAKKIVAMVGKKLWLIPVALFLAGFIVAGIGPGAVPALAIIPALGVAVALEVGYNPLMLGMIGCLGLCGGRMTPITPEAAIIEGSAQAAGISGVMPTVMVCNIVLGIVASIIFFFVWKGHKVKPNEEALSVSRTQKFNGQQIIALVSILLMLVLLIGFKMNIGVAPFVVAALLLVFGIGDAGKAIKAMPWGTIIMVLGVGSLVNVVNELGGIEIMSNGLASIMNRFSAGPVMGLSAGLLSLVSSALGVVYPTMMPMCPDIAAQVGGVNPVALMAAVGAGGSLAGFSPMSTGGALLIAALGNTIKNFSKEDENKAFVQLLIVAASCLLLIAVMAAFVFNPIANVMHPMG